MFSERRPRGSTYGPEGVAVVELLSHLVTLWTAAHHASLSSDIWRTPNKRSQGGKQFGIVSPPFFSHYVLLILEFFVIYFILFCLSLPLLILETSSSLRFILSEYLGKALKNFHFPAPILFEFFLQMQIKSFTIWIYCN